MIRETVAQSGAHRAGPARALRLSVLAVLALVAAYLVSPILMPVHVEGFTGFVASLALHLRQDSLSSFDPIAPLNVEFFGMTKLGWILAVSALTAVGLSTSAAMTILTWLAALVFAVGTAFLVRRWTATPVWAILAALVLLQGVSETAFFFNDNLIASALAVAGLCALYGKRRIPGAVLCGLLFGAAVLTRTDTALMGAPVPLILFEREGVSKRFLAALAVAGLAGGAVLLGTFAWFDATILDLFEVAAAAVQAWDRPPSFGGAIALLFFLGIPGAFLVLAGIVTLVRNRNGLLAARLLLVPALYLAVLWDKLWEVRQLLPLSPFLAGVAALALSGIFSSARSRRSAVVQGAFAGIALGVLFGPPLFDMRADGPRVLIGRIENIQHWRSWQSDTARDFDLLESLADRSAAGTHVLIVDFWNEDRYAHLVLQEAGFRARQASTAECRPIAEEFVKGSVRILLVRLQAAYVPYWRAISGERLRRWGIPCIDSVRANDLAFVASRTRLEELDLPRPGIPIAGRGKLRAALIERSDLPALIESYEDDRIAWFDPEVRIGTPDEAAAATRRRTRFGG
jgi:hypothetical protein